MRLLAASASAALCFIAVPAFAADAIVDVPQPPAVDVVPFIWTGVYVGAQVGYVDGGGDFDEALDVIGLPLSASGVTDVDGLIGGVHLGYNYQFSSGLVLGAYVDYDFTSADLDAFFDDGTSALGSAEVDGIARGLVKAGFAYDRALFYGQGGAAYFSLASNSGEATGGDEFGWAVGAGADYALTDNLIIGSDYVYHRFDDFDNDDPAFSNDPKASLALHTFRAKVAYKF